MKTQNFTAVDFETATSDRMICEIGIVVVKDMKIIKKIQSFVKPPLGNYDPNTLIHNHVRPEDWTNAPTFEEIWPEIAPCFEGQTVVSHNQGFDYPALMNNLKYYNIMPMGIERFECTQHYCHGKRLGVGCEYFGIPFSEEEHHNALYDAEACALIAMHMFNEEPVDLERIEGIDATYCDAHGYKPSMNKNKRNKLKGIAKLKEHSTTGITKHLLAEGINPNSPLNPLRGKKVVFTGVFLQNRKALEKMMKEVMGAIIPASVSKNVNFFFIGEDPGETKMAAYEKLKHNGFEVPTFYQHDLDEILSGVWGPYQDAGSAVKKLSFTYEHYTQHHIEFKNGRNVLASREVFTGDDLSGNRKYFDVVLGNLGAFDSVTLEKDTNICILSNKTIESLEQGIKDKTIQAIEDFYNNNRAIVFNFSFLSEKDVTDFCKKRCEGCGDELTLGYLKKYIG